jgi:NAD+ synthase (glutamine-hydrolysing)
MLRLGFPPAKIYRLAKYVFKDSYPSETILHWLKVFVKRFFTQQFKRSCMPDGPKVGTVSLSPRSDWRMPSDASYNLWLTELENLK